MIHISVPLVTEVQKRERMSVVTKIASSLVPAASSNGNQYGNQYGRHIGSKGGM